MSFHKFGLLSTYFKFTSLHLIKIVYSNLKCLPNNDVNGIFFNLMV